MFLPFVFRLYYQYIIYIVILQTESSLFYGKDRKNIEKYLDHIPKEGYDPGDWWPKADQMKKQGPEKQERKGVEDLWPQTDKNARVPLKMAGVPMLVAGPYSHGEFG